MSARGDDLHMIGRFDMQRIAGVVSVIALLGVTGCSSDPDVDIGDARTGEQLRDYAALWEGYAEAHTFADGSDKVRISLNEDGEGTLEIGESPAITVDPDHPPAGARSDLVPGFGYTVRFAEVETQRLRFRFAPHEALAGWCSAQTPVIFTTDPQTWACLPNGSTRSAGMDECFLTPDGEEERAVDCKVLSLCQYGLCFCTEESCAVPDLQEEQELDYAIDGALEQGGNSLVGTLRLGSTSTKNPVIRLRRQ